MSLVINKAALMNAMVSQEMSFKELAEKAGVSLGTLYYISRVGRGTPRIIGKMVHALNIDPKEVVLYDDKPSARAVKPQIDVEAVEDIMKAKKIRYSDLAGWMGISKQAMWKRVHGVRPRMRSIRELAELLEVEPNEITKGV